MKGLYLLLIPVLLSFIACSEDSGTVDKNWKNANDLAYQEIASNNEYRKLVTESGPDGLYYKVLKSGTGTEYPLQTSSVKVLYKGMYYDGTVFDAGTSVSEVPTKFSVAGTVRGFSFALQNMVVGDKWDIWIPYYLGYGYSDSYDQTTGTLIMKGCTVLHFEVELVEIIKFP
ncbi:MAG: FKBP-type peptidyl-prolyl cis-trans isomerase [Dysgonamonadaceae bacterium]|jgi:FKBP-type peptidyl-prolyl cis-trans isomerase|nr:FKBP-type peptidyl-prolyl cis-trans isomerase [Dysgonamonadaceae bacterium]